MFHSGMYEFDSRMVFIDLTESQSFFRLYETVTGLEDVSKFPALFAELARRGWTDAELAKLANGNVLRVLEQAEAVSARLRKARAPSQATIQQLDHPATTSAR